MSIYIYERKRLENWVDAFCEKFKKSNPNLCINKFSEHNISEGYSFNDKFEFFLKNNISKKSSFCDDEIYQIINRCSLLRSLDKKFALKLILAAEYSIDYFIKEFKPTLFIAPRIDSYILDILDRKLTKINIKFIGFWRSAFLKDHFFLTKRGEVNTINKKLII